MEYRVCPRVCAKRSAECHSTCPRYLKFEQRRKRKLEKEADARNKILLRRVEKAEEKLST